MKRRMNAGRNRGRVGMAWIHRDASYVVGCKDFDKWLDDFLGKQKREMGDVLKTVLPAMESMRPGLGLGLSLAAELSPFFSIPLRSPMSVLGIDSFAEAPKRKEVTIVGGRMNVGVPAFMLPRDNGHRQSSDDRAKYDELSVQNTYVPPVRKEDRFGSPIWPEGTELVSGRHPDAGEWGKLCYRTACQAPNAFYFNKGTHKHYCQECADIIDRENMLGEKLHTLAVKEGEHT